MNTELPNEIPALNKDAAGARIVRAIRDGIRNGVLQSGTKLQSEKALTRIYGCNVYHVRQALQQLKESGLIYSVPKVGAFVAAPEMDSAAAPLPAAAGLPVSGAIRCRTGSNSPAQRQLWKQLLDELSDRNHFLQVTMDYETAELDRDGLPDVRECSSPLALYQQSEMPLLNVRNFFVDAAAAGMEFLSDCALPFYYSGNVLFYNRELLAKERLPLPEYRDFAGQSAYLEELLDVLEKHPALTLPGSNQQPLLRLGNVFNRILDALIAPEVNPGDWDEFADACEKAVAIRRRFRISPPKQANANIHAFLAGKTPFFLGFSSDIIQFRQLYSEWQPEIYPYFSVDDSCSTVAVPLVVSRESRQVIESIRFLQFLQSESPQRHLAEQGMIPLHPEFCGAGHYLVQTDAAAGGLAAVQRARPLFFQTPEEHYIGLNIFNIELWECILNGRSVRAALNNSRCFAQAYLHLQLDRQTMNERQESMRLYN